MTALVAMRLDGIDLSLLSKRQISVAHLLHLPFRLRVGVSESFQITLGDLKYDVYVRNKMAITGEEAAKQAILDYGRNPDLYHSDVIVVCRRPELDEQAIIELRQNLSGVSLAPLPFNPYFLEPTLLPRVSEDGALNALSLLLSAYLHASRWKAYPNDVRYQAGDLPVDIQVVILGSENSQLTQDHLNWLFQLLTAERREGFSILPPLVDLGAEEIAHLNLTLERQSEYAFYELALSAQIQLVQHNNLNAVVMAAAAYEGAHAAFTQLTLGARLPFSPKKRREYIDKYIKAATIANLNRITPSILMEYEERPTVAQIEACERAITIRNDIMHSKTTGAGTPKIRGHSENTLVGAYGDIMKVYDYYVLALERRLDAAKGLKIGPAHQVDPAGKPSAVGLPPILTR